MGHPQPVNETGLAFGYNGAPSSLEQAVNYAFIQLGAGAVRATVDDLLRLMRRAAPERSFRAGRSKT
ncbi:hypothetical protein CDQ92_16500 [Sphingopyxis bauzanensis]|uniref:Uncharacterized protein n=1 Tax=Sphingopyxis bauzanensis TaxID=651663 RepID=A0A246JPI0_9SPHN|nr:hypothetical protein [Sphingopyxis bauzanensis]OWQ94671.1 hypothetical protein CDQ92_16500 [Sphingopyxis bauzanensis]